MKLFLSFVINIAALLVVAYLLPGVQVASIWVAAVVIIVLSLLNTFLRPILVILTLPFHIVTLGLTLFVLNACIILLADYLVAGFSVGGFWWAILFSIAMSLIGSFLATLVDSK